MTDEDRGPGRPKGSTTGVYKDSHNHRVLSFLAGEDEAHPPKAIHEALDTDKEVQHTRVSINRLYERGLVDRETGEGPTGPRYYYAITDEGHDVLAEVGDG